MSRISTTQPATTRRPASAGRLAVSVISPEGDVDRVVYCRTREQCLEVVEHEAAHAELWTIILLTRSTDTGVQPIARWAVGRHGLGRTPYRANAAREMEELIHAARRAYVHGRMTRAAVQRWLVDEYDASPEDAFLAAAAAKLLLED